MKASRRARVFGQVGIGVLTLAVSACSSSSKSTSTPTTAAAAKTSGSATPSGTPISIELIYDNTGPGAAPELIEGENAAIKVINQAGGINGHPLKLIVCATQNDPNQADSCARQAVSDKVAAVVGELTLQKGHETILTNNHIPIVGAVLSGTDFTVPAQFPISGTTVVEIPADADALASAGATKISLARIEIDGGQAFKGFADAGLKHFGLTVTNDVPIPIGAPDMASYVQAALANGANGIIVILPGPDATAFIKQLKTTAPNVPIALVGTQKEKVYGALGSASDGIISSLSEVPPAYGSAADQQYVSAMNSLGYTEQRGFRLDSYAAVMAFAAVAKQVPSVTSQALWDYLPTVTGLETGLTTTLQWKTGGVAGLPRVFTSCAFVVKEESQKDVPVYAAFKDAFTWQNCPTPAKA